MMKKSEIENLFQKYIANDCDEHETRLLLKYFEDEQNALFFKALISEYLPEEVDIDTEFQKKMDQSFAKTDEFFEKAVFSADISRQKPAIYKLWKYIAAACVVLLVSFSLFFYLTQTSERPSPKLNISLLVLPSGRIDSLESQFKQGRIIIERNGLALVQEKENVLKIIRVKTVKETTNSEMYALKVARGRQLRLKLIDGSIVALNSLSELRFSLGFSNDKRWLELTGEGYFDIVSNHKLPLFVKTPDQLIKVYGTKFNVRNYLDDEEAKTTLFRGKVSVRETSNNSVLEHILSPGEQVVIKKKDKNITQNRIDNELEILSWTDNKFVYEGAPLRQIMKDFSRWYDVEVDWESIPDFSYQGTIPHDYSLEKAIKLLEKTGSIKINLHDNRITF